MAHSDGSPSTRESGQTMVLSVAFLVVLIGFCALLIDGGSWLWTKRSLQGDADAAALAAVREMPTSPGNAQPVAEDYAENRNSDDQAELQSFVSSTDDMTVTVVLGRSMASSPFGRLLNVEGTDIRARAKARIAQVSGVDGVLPFAALEGTLEVSNPPVPQAITVSPGGIQTGHIGAIAAEYSQPDCSNDTNSATETERAITSWHGTGGITTCGTPVDDTISTSVGARPNTVKDGINQRFGGSNGLHPTDLFNDVVSYDADTDGYVLEKPTSSRIGFIPVIRTGLPGEISDWSQLPGVAIDVTIVDYIMVYIGHTGKSGEPGYVTGSDCDPECVGSQVQVVVTPIPGMIPPNFDYELRDGWDPNSLAPTAITLDE